MSSERTRRHRNCHLMGQTRWTAACRVTTRPRARKPTHPAAPVHAPADPRATRPAQASQLACKSAGRWLQICRGTCCRSAAPLPARCASISTPITPLYVASNAIPDAIRGSERSWTWKARPRSPDKAHRSPLTHLNQSERMTIDENQCDSDHPRIPYQKELSRTIGKS